MNFIEIMLDMLTSAYTRKDLRNNRKKQPPETNIGRLFNTFGCGLDIIRDHFERVRLWDDIDKARGLVLDRYGQNFGVKRDGANDDFYRLMIKVKMISLLSGGDVNTVIESAASLFGVASTDIELFEIFPAKIWLYINEDEFDEEHARIAPLIAHMVKRIIAAGVENRIFFKTRSDFKIQLLSGVASTTICHVDITPRSGLTVESRGQVFPYASTLDHINIAVYPAASPHRIIRRQFIIADAALETIRHSIQIN